MRLTFRIIFLKFFQPIIFFRIIIIQKILSKVVLILVWSYHTNIFLGQQLFKLLSFKGIIFRLNVLRKFNIDVDLLLLGDINILDHFTKILSSFTQYLTGEILKFIEAILYNRLAIWNDDFLNLRVFEFGFFFALLGVHGITFGHLKGGHSIPPLNFGYITSLFIAIG